MKARQNNEEGEVKRREKGYVFPRFAGVVFHVLAEGDKTCKRGNERPYAAEVYPQQQIVIIPRKLRQQNCRRYVADYLARQHADKQGILF